MKKFSYTFLFVLSALLFHAQNVEFQKANFPGKKDEFKEVMKKYEQGLLLYTQGRRDFEDFKRAYLIQYKYFPVSRHDYGSAGNQSFGSAFPLLSDANRFNPRNASLNYNLGFISFMNSASDKETLKYFETAYELNPAVEADISYWLAWSYHLNAQWSKAIEFYEKYLLLLQQRAKANVFAIEDVNKKIAECKTGQTLSANPERVFVDNLGSSINTSAAEYGPAITADEESIFFTARRQGSTGGKRDASDNDYFEDLYSSVKVKGKWQPSKALSKNVNTEYHDAAAGISPDGTKLYVYRNTGNDGGDIYESVLSGDDWQTPVRMSKNINTKYHESSVSLSFDGKRLFFVSDRDLGVGNRDIYYCDLNINGEWLPAKNIGVDINTKYGEEAVFMHPDGKTMYFSSKGHNTMGGYDVFKTTLVNGKWTTPVNLGYPINGPDDDVFFVMSGSGNRAYFASAKQGGFGNYDIYKITFLGAEKSPLLNTQDQLLAMIANPVSNLKTENEVEVKTAKLTILKGIVSDEKTNKPLETSIDLIDNDKNLVLATFKSNSSSGKYLVTLPSGKNYGIAVKRDGYLFHSENFNLPDSAEFQEFDLNIKMKSIEVGSAIVLKNIFFDSGKSELRPESTSELERLIKLLKENPNINIELSSHTDNIGSDEFNLKLSDARARSVHSYLVAHGIDATRLTAKGYGETQAIASNDTEAGRQSNRRTEFKVLGK